MFHIYHLQLEPETVDGVTVDRQVIYAVRHDTGLNGRVNPFFESCMQVKSGPHCLAVMW